MKLIRILLVPTLLLLAFGSLAGQSLRTVNPLIQPQWHQTNPWNARCPGVGQNRAHAGSHALALAKTMKYWAYPTYGTGTVSYVDDDFGNLSQNLGVEINWDGMSNTLIFQTTQRFIYTCGLATYTNYEYDYSTSSLANVRSALINFYSYDDAIQQRDRDEYTNFYWKSLIRTELDNARPVIYAVTLANNREIAFIVDGYDEAGLFHVNFSNVNLMDAWVDLNNLAVQGEEIPESNQQMLTGIRPSLGPVDISENFEEGFGNWNWQFSGNANWTISTEAAYYGSSSAKSGNIDDNQVTSMHITINVTRPDTISFYKKVSCEAEPNDLYDHLAFFIDGVEQERWSGDGNWEYHEYPVTPGVHEFRWRYLKDGASDYFGDCAWVDAITFPEGTTPLGAPRFAEAEVINGNDIRLDWMPPDGTNPGLLGYKIFRNGVEIAQFLNPAMATFFDYNMPNGDYTYFLRAVYAEGVSNPGNSTNARVEVPYAPENLVASLQGINTARLQWDTPPNLRNRALMGYQIYRDNMVIAQVENPEANQYDDANLPEGVYYYEVTAIYATGESARSNMAQIAIGVPEPPANFRATVSGDDVSLAWNQVADTEFLTGFKIYRNNALVVTITDPAQLAYIDQNLPNGQYSYFIKAVYGDVDSGNSSTVTVRVEVPYPPVGLSATVNGDDVTLNWVNPETVRALTHYYIYRNNQLIAAVFNPNTTLYTDQNLANGLYTYAVSAVYSGVESAQSAPVTALVEVLYPPRNLSALVNLADVSLTWQIPVTQGGLRSFNGYNLYRNNSLVAAISNPSQTSYLDQGVPNGIYTYELSAVYTMGESSRIGVPNVTVEVLYPITQINYQIEDDDIVLAWAAPATMPSGRTDERALLNYNIYSGGSLLASTTDLTYRDANLANGWYQYFVTALYSSGESEPSPTLDIEVEVLYPPTDLQAVVDQDDVNLSWTAPINSGGLGRGFLGYQLYRDGALIASPALPAYTDANLANGFYEYQVFAVYAGGISEPTSLVQALVEVLYPPRSLSHQVLDRNDVSLSWQMPLSTGGLRPFVEYQLYRNDALLVQTTDTGYLDADLADGNYHYYVVAVYGTGTSLASNSTNAFIEYPYPPANLQTAVNGADVTVSWDQVMGTEVRYLVYRDDVQIATTGSLSMLDSGLANGTYQYYVRTGNGSESGLSDPSDTVAAVVDVPYPPRMLSGTVNGDDISLVWQAPATAPREVLSYNVYRDGLLIDNVSDPAYADMDLANGIYDYYVTAVHTSGESVPSNSWQGLVELLYPATALNAVVTGDDVALSWTAAVTSGGLRDFQGYKVYRDALEIAQVMDTSYNDLNLANGVYDYYVKAVYGTGLSAASNTATAIVEVLYPPTQLSYQVSDDDIILSWQAAATSARGFLGYKLYRDGSLLAQTSSLSYTDTSLANGTYSYYVTALYDSGESTASNTVVVNLEVLYPATALSAVVVGDDVALSWTAAVSSGGLRALLGYKVLRDGIEIGQTLTTSYDDLDLANSTYYYTVIASYSSGDSEPCPEAMAFVEVLYPATNLSYQVINDSIVLAWNAAPNSNRALQNYNIYRDDSLLAQTTDTVYTDAGLANGIYTYYVKANYITGESVPTNSVTATVEVLYPPTQLTYSVSDDDVSLFWQAAATSGGLRNLLGYKIYRDGSFLSQTAGLTYTDAALTNSTYSYYVTALYDSGESTPTNTVTALVEVLYPATALNAVVTGDDVALSWTAAVTSGGLREFQGYKVYRDALEIAQVMDTSYNDLNLANGVYDYYVKAVYGTGLSAASNTATAIVEVLYPPTQLSYQVSDDDILLSWQAAATSARGFLGYKLYRDGSLLAQTSSLTYTDASLANGTYSYYVTALYDSGESSASNTVVVNLEVLYPATALSAVVVGDDVALSWTAAVSSGGLRALLGYKVLRDGIEIGQTLTTSYDDLDLANGTYYYTVIASYSSGDSEPCPEAMAFVEVLYPATNLSYQVINDSIVLAWNAAPNSNRALQNYKIYRDDSLLAQTTDTVYTDAGLANGIYTYYVKANYITGESVPTNSVTATVEVLYPPTQLTYSVSDDDVSLYWQAAATSGGLRNLLGYKIYRDGSFLSQTAGLTYTDAALTNGTYSYYVTALYDSGESTPTNTVTALVEVLYPATALNAVVTGDDVALSWTAAVTSGGLREFQGYKVYRDALEIAQVMDTSYNDLNLANGVYDYYVKAVYGTGLSAASNTATAIVEVLYPPTILSYQVSDDDILLSWQAAATSARGFLGYKLYRDGSLLAQTSSLTYTDASLANGTYSYYITALYDSGESSASNTVNATIEITYPVTALTASVDEDAVTLSWTLPATAPIRAFRGYFIYRNGNLHQVLDNPALTSWTDQGLANGSYSYWLLAVYDAGLSIQSNTVTIEINVMPDLPAPVGFTAVLSGERDVTLSWQAPPINPQFYRIYRNAVEIATTESTIYQDLALPNGNYDYYVKAQYALGLSSASETATINIMIADPPANLTASLQDGNDVVLAWLAPSQGEIGYVLYRNNQELAYISNPLTLSYIDYDRPNGTYSYRVAAVYSSVISVPGNIASIQVELAYPAQNLVLNQAGNNISLSWTAPSDPGGFQTYRVYRNGSLLAQTTAQSYQDNNLANGAYSYYLTAVYSIGESQPTATQNATIQIAYTATALEAQVIGDDVTLSWTAPVDTGYLQSYNILRDGIVIANTATTSYHDNNLANGSYSYAIVAVYSFGDALPSNYVNIGIELLYPPTGLVANVIDSDVHLSWTAPVNQGGLRALTGYKIYRNGNLLAQSAVTSYTDEDLANGTYSYHIVASYNSGDSAPGNTQEVLIEVLYPASNLVATATSDDIDLSWDAVPPSGASLLGYKIYRNGLLLAQTALTTYTDQNLNNGSYSYRIAAIYASGESAQSNEASATIMIPYIPTGFTVQMVGVRTAQLSWILPGQSETGFTLYKNGAFLVQITNPQGTVYLDQNLANGEYAYQIRADYPGISSELSAPVGVTVLNAYAPQNLTFNQAGNAVTLNWNPPTDIWGLNSYSVYRNEELLVSGSFTSYVDENLPNNWYTYYVVARYGTAVSPHSNSVNVHIVVPYPATNLTGTIDSNNVSLSWLPSSDLHGFMFYHIFCNNQQIGITNETTYQHTNLPNGVYTYHVTAVYSGGDAPPTNDYTASIILPYPPQAAFAVAGDDQIIINWGAPSDVTGLTGYRLYANDVLLSEQSELFYHHNNPANNDYTYSVEAMFGAVVSPSITTNTIHWEKIYSPSGLVIELVGTDISLGWQPVSDTGFFVNYKIYQNDQLIDTSVDTSFIAEDLTNGVYNYKVTASYLNGESTATNTETETVLIAYPPSNLTGSLTGNSLSLDWDAPVDTGLMTQYLVYRNDQLFTALQQTETTILNLPNGSYDFFVVAEYQSGLMSLPTNTFTADIIMAYPPRNLTAVATADSVEVSWQAPVDTNNLTGYRLVCNGNPLPTIAPDALSFTHTGLANGAYIYQLFALYSGGAESYTGPVSTVVIKPYPVQNLVPSVEITSNTVYLSWDAPVDTYGLTGYRISRDDQVLQEINQRQYFDPDLGNGTYLYKVEALYGDLVSLPATTNATVFVVGIVPVVNATVVETGYLITWEAPNVITPPDYYEIFFLLDGMQQDTELWVTVAICDTVFSYIDRYHGGIEWGEFLWAVLPRWTGGNSNPTFSNVLHIEMPPPPPPTVTKIVGNFPNPFNPHTNIVIRLKQAGQVVLKVYNLRGQLVRTLVNTPMPVGEHSIAFDGKDDSGRVLPSGVYVYRLDTKGYHRSARMILNK